MNHRLMKKYKKRISIFAVMMSVIMFALAGQNVSAATGNVYTCKITASYQHPVTGKIEDSGGKSVKGNRSGNGRRFCIFQRINGSDTKW